MSRKWAFGQIGLLVLTLGPSLAAQTSTTTRGLWIGLGFGGGHAAASCSGCVDEARHGGSTFFTSVAGGLSSRLALGAEANAWITGLGVFNSGETGKTWRQDFALSVYYYPRARPGLFLKTGLTASGYVANYPPLRHSGMGPGILAGLGYDVRVSSALFLRPVLTLTVGFLGDVRQEDQFLQSTLVDSGVAQHIVKLELGLMFHPKHQ